MPSPPPPALPTPRIVSPVSFPTSRPPQDVPRQERWTRASQWVCLQRRSAGDLLAETPEDKHPLGLYSMEDTTKRSATRLAQPRFLSVSGAPRPGDFQERVPDSLSPTHFSHKSFSINPLPCLPQSENMIGVPRHYIFSFSPCVSKRVYISSAVWPDVRPAVQPTA